MIANMVKTSVKRHDVAFAKVTEHVSDVFWCRKIVGSFVIFGQLYITVVCIVHFKKRVRTKD